VTIQQPNRLALLVAGAVASAILLVLTKRDDVPDASPAAQRPGYYVRDANLLGTGPDGMILYRMTARSADENTGDGSVTLTGIQIAYEPAAEVPWLLRATSGRISPERDVVWLSGDVLAVTRPDAGQNTRIRTDMLEIDPSQFIASTDRRVTIDHERGQISATGMRVYLKQDRLQLNTDVHGRFLP
jgi:LPS export ABC transporter protein LptC